MTVKDTQGNNMQAITLRGLRSKYGLTLDELAAQCSISKSQVYGIEARNDFRRERFNHLMELSEALSIHIFDLIEMNEADKRENEQNPISQQ